MNSSDRTINLTSKPLRKFAEGDTLYVRKMKNAFDYVYFCRFLKIEKGILHVAPISCERSYALIPATMTARASNCYLWGQGVDDLWPRCHWFESLDAPAGTRRAKAPKKAAKEAAQNGDRGSN